MAGGAGAPGAPTFRALNRSTLSRRSTRRRRGASRTGWVAVRSAAVVAPEAEVPWWGTMDRMSVTLAPVQVCPVCGEGDDLVTLGPLVACTSCAQRLARLAALEENRRERARR